MVRSTTIAAALLFAPVAAAQEQVDPGIAWVIAAPYGTSTYAGRAWTRLGPEGESDVYAISATDALKSDGKFSTVWILGDHRLNKKVAFRNTMARYLFNCKLRTQTLLHYSEYGPDGDEIRSFEGGSTSKTVVPGTNFEDWLEIACRFK